MFKIGSNKNESVPKITTISVCEVHTNQPKAVPAVSGTLYNKRISAIKKGFPFYTNGATGYVSATDVASVMIQLMQSEISGERFSVIAENRTFKDIIFLIAEKLGVQKPKLEAKPWMLSVGWRLDWLSATFFNTKRRLSKYSTRSLLSSDTISNTKIKNALNFEFQRIESVIAEVVRLHQK
mgnify:CR=1 FL=1